MASSDSVLFANLLSQNEVLTKANLHLQLEVDSSKKLQFRQEILAKQLESRIEELKASIKTQAADNTIWATQVDQLLVTVNGQIEEALTSLRARSAGHEEASLPRRTAATINEQIVCPARNVDENLLRLQTKAREDAADMNPTHCEMLEEAFFGCKPETLATAFEIPTEKNLVRPQSAVHPNTKYSMRPESAPFVPSTKVKPPANVFKGSLERSIHAGPPINTPNYRGIHTSLTLTPTAPYTLDTHVRTHSGPIQLASFCAYEDLVPSKIDEWLEASTPPLETFERTRWTPMRQPSSTTAEDVVSNEHDRSLERSMDPIYPIGFQVESSWSTMPQKASKAKSIDPLKSVLKAGQSPLVSNDKPTNQPTSTQVSPLNLPQAIVKSPTSEDGANAELSRSSYSPEYGPLIPVGLPKYNEDRDMATSAGPAFDPFSSLLDCHSEPAAASGHQVSPALDCTSVTPGPSATYTSKSMIHSPSELSAALTSTNLAPSLHSEPSKEPTYESLAPNPFKSSTVQTYTSLAPAPAEASPAHTHKSMTHSEPSSALTHKSLPPSESPPKLTYKVMDTSVPSHTLFEEMMSASKAFSEKTEAQRKAATDKAPTEDETVENELADERKPTYTRVLGSALDAHSKELVLKPSKMAGRLGLKSQPANRPLHLKFERVAVKLLLPSGAIKRLGHLDRPAMANAEICMHMYISEEEATSITLVAQIHSTGNDFLVLTATQARPVLEFNVNFMLPGQLNTDTMTFNTVHLNDQDDFSATSSVTEEIENLREPITQRLKGSLRHMSFAFSHDNFNMVEQEDLPTVEDYQELTDWDPEAVTFFEFMRSFTGNTRKVVSMLFADEKNSTEDVDDMLTTVSRNSRKKRVWRDNGVMWEVTKDSEGNEKWTLASSTPEISKHL